MPRMHRTLGALLVLVTLAGCDRRHSEAIVLEKEHIAVQAPTPVPTAPAIPPVTEQNALPDAAQPEPSAEPELREMAPDEIAVDGVVMKEALRGTAHDPRASDHEQWLVKVRTDDGRTFNVHADRAGYEKIKPGDRVKVSFQVGKYTGTVWGADLE